MNNGPFWRAIPESLLLEPKHYCPSAWAGHVPFAFWIIQAMRPSSLVELGTWHGMSYLAFCQAIVRFGTDTSAFAVDTWEGDDHAGKLSNAAYEELQLKHDPNYSAFSSLLRMTFDDAAERFEDRSVDLLHIDGLHTYEAVKHDFETWLPKMSERGVILFHDTQVHEREFGVHRLWAELTDRYPVFEFTHSHGLGVLFVGDVIVEGLASLMAAGESAPEVRRVRELFGRLGERIQFRQQLADLDSEYRELRGRFGVRAVLKAQRLAGL